MNVPENVIVLARRSVKKRNGGNRWVSHQSCQSDTNESKRADEHVAEWIRLTEEVEQKQEDISSQSETKLGRPSSMSLEPSREFANSPQAVSERILALAATGLKLRDISSLLHIHPEIVRRVLEEQAKAQ